eukprot:TRINITY_DN57963_c0_g1_i1.p1 TRINITY_DN57963_c0_g1~~TRINITY_DN57963_c0_g1_i1.p1  ORF type:complete len:574 (+),score=91.44 TRINITY_DN57963_c0_g1_i1:132-1853(+)
MAEDGEHDESSAGAAGDVTNRETAFKIQNDVALAEGLEAPAGSSEVPASAEEYIDWALEYADDWGLFQRRSTGIVSAANFLCGAQTIVHIFVTLPPRLTGVCTGKAGHCEADCSLPSDKRHYGSADFSLASEFHLICQSAWEVPMLGTLFFFGFLLGVTYIGRMADKRGRRKAYLYSIFITQLGALIAAFAPNYTLYALARGLTGLGVGGLGIASYVWNAELLPARIRPCLICTQNCGFALGVIFLAPLAYTMPHWRWISMVLFLLGIPFLLCHRFVLESPKWLAGAGRLEDAHQVLCKIAALNGRSSPPAPHHDAAKDAVPKDAKNAAGNAEGKPGILGLLLCDPRLSGRFLVLCLSWFSLSLGYYGVSMNASNIGSSIYSSSAALSFVELPMFPVALWLVKPGRAGRRGATAGGLLVGGGCCLFCVLFTDNASMSMALAFAGKAAIAMAFGVVYLYAAELFPMSLRSGSMGLQSLCARLGGMIAPIAANLGQTSKALPFIIFGVPCVVAGALLCSLPETAGQPLPDTIEDIKLPAKRAGFPCPWWYSELEEDKDECVQGSAEPTKFGTSIA